VKSGVWLGKVGGMDSNVILHVIWQLKQLTLVNYRLQHKCFIRCAHFRLGAKETFFVSNL